MTSREEGGEAEELAPGSSASRLPLIDTVRVRRASAPLPRSADALPTHDMGELHLSRGQLQMELLFQRIQNRLFGDRASTRLAHYVLERPIGQGGMGMVYEAIDTHLKRRVALKLMLPEFLRSAHGNARLLREARAMAQISHANVVHVYDVGEAGGMVFIAMEFVNGVTVSKWLTAASRSSAEILDVFIQAGAGLAAAHRAGLVHRDFKPDNVLVDEDHRARVLDFGLAFPRATAVEADATEPASTRAREAVITSSGQVAGTAAYMSPEQFQAQPLDGRSDEFSYSVALFEALFGRRPFAGRTFAEVSQNVCTGSMLSLPPQPRIASWLMAMLRRGLAIDRDRRFATMTEMVCLLAAGRLMMAARRPGVEPAGTQAQLLSRLQCTFEEHVASTPASELLRVHSPADGRSRLVVLPHEPDARHVRAAFTAYAERLRAEDAALLAHLRPVASVIDDTGVALVFDHHDGVTLGALMRQQVGRDLRAALLVARNLATTIHALAGLGLTIALSALDTALIRIDRYEVALFDPTLVTPQREVDGTGRYRVVGHALQGMLTGEVLHDSARPAARVDGQGDERATPAQIRRLGERLIDAEAGYHSAAGLIQDLDLCLAHWDRRRRVPGFDLARYDVGPRFRVSDVVRGRTREIDLFERAFREVAAGGSALFLVSGPSGIGKTLLIDEACGRFEEGRRIRGKCDQYSNNQPYATIAQALRQLIREIADEPRPVRERWRAGIVRAVAPNAEPLFAVFPELQALIGEQPNAASVPPMESAARFDETLKRLLIACAAQAGALIVVLDDLQWCDAVSGRLIASLCDDPEASQLLWIGAFRDGELDDGHPLYPLLDTKAQRVAPTTWLPLAPLSLEDLQTFLADTLGGGSQRTLALATFFLDRTDGNPLFARTLLASLHDQGLFWHSAREELWHWNEDAIRAAELPRDLQALISRKIASLSPAARELLTVASCFGRDLEAPILLEGLTSQERGYAHEDLARALRECIGAGLVSVTPLPASSGATTELINFTHDRVQQTAYVLLGEERREATQLAIGRALLDRCTPADLAGQLFRIVGYLNAGARGAPPSLRDRIVELNLLAARRALVANSFEDCVKFLQVARALLPADHWQSRYEQAFELHVTQMHAMALLGRHEEETSLFEQLKHCARTTVHLGEVYELKVSLESSRGEHRAAIDRGIEGLRALGERMPRGRARLAALTELTRTAWALRGLTPDAIVARPPSGDKDATTSRLLIALSAPAYLVDRDLLAILMMRIVRRSLERGMTDASSHGFAGLGVIASGFSRYARAHELAGIARRLHDRFPNRWLQQRLDLVCGIFILPWTEPFEACEEVLGEGARVAADNADFAYASYNAASQACLMFYRGVDLETVISAADIAHRHVQRARDYDMETVVTTVLRGSKCLRGETDRADSFSGDGFDEAAFEARLDERTTPIGVFFYRAIRCSVMYALGHSEAACELGRQAAAYTDHAFSNPSLAEYLFSYAMALLDRWPALSGRERRAARRVIGEATARFETWARSCRANYGSRYFLLLAEQQRVRGGPDVLDHLNSALEVALEHDRIHHVALAAELAGRHCFAAGQLTVGRIYLRQARAAYLRWGAAGKAITLAGRMLLPEPTSTRE